MTIISDTAKRIINKNRKWKKVTKDVKRQESAGGNMEEYFLGKDPRKTKYYKDVMREKKKCHS